MEVTYKDRKLSDIRKLEQDLLKKMAENRPGDLFDSDVDRLTVRLMLLTMQCKGLVKKNKHGRYVITHKGKDRLASHPKEDK